MKKSKLAIAALVLDGDLAELISGKIMNFLAFTDGVVRKDGSFTFYYCNLKEIYGR